MAGRYTIIQHIQNPFVVSGCPVILTSHALTKNIENDCVFLQCKFKNLEAKEIQAFYINVQCFDVTGHSLDSVDDFSYLDLQVQQYQLFGDQIPVYLNDKETRIFSIIPSKIVFSDGTVWESNTSTPFKPFDKEPCSIESLGELSEQYKRDLHAICHQDQKHSYLPSVQQGFIVCGCGAIVLDGTEHCPDCSVDFEKLFPLNNSDKLQEELNQYKQEQAEQEKQLRLAEEDRKHQNHLKKQQLIKKAKKLGIIVGSIFALIAACVLVIQVLIPSIRYSMAENAIASGKYEEAITTFEDLGDFKDSPQKIKETKYVWAESKLESGDTDGAVKMFTELDDYSDSKSRLRKILLPQTEEVLNKLKSVDTGIPLSASIDGDTINITLSIPETNFHEIPRRLEDFSQQQLVEAFNCIQKLETAIDSWIQLKDDFREVQNLLIESYETLGGNKALYSINTTVFSTDNIKILEFHDTELIFNYWEDMEKYSTSHSLHLLGDIASALDDNVSLKFSS